MRCNDRQHARSGIISQMPLGLYISVPFCRTKCTYCNFASDVFSRAVFERYVDRVCADIHTTPRPPNRWAACSRRDVDSIYLGGGTPTLFDFQQLERLFVTIRQNFRLRPETEITVECAPGTLTPEMLDTLAALRREPRQPGRAVVCGSGGGVGRAVAQAGDRAGRHCAPAARRDFEHQC